MIQLSWSPLVLAALWIGPQPALGCTIPPSCHVLEQGHCVWMWILALPVSVQDWSSRQCGQVAEAKLAALCQRADAGSEPGAWNSVKPRRALEAGACSTASLAGPQASSTSAPGAALGLSLLVFSCSLVRSSSESPFFFFFSSPILQKVKGHRRLLQRCWQSCFGGVSVEQDEGDVLIPLGCRCGSAGPAAAGETAQAQRRSGLALLGGSRKKGENKSPGFGRRRCGEETSQGQEHSCWQSSRCRELGLRRAGNLSSALLSGCILSVLVFEEDTV